MNTAEQFWSRVLREDDGCWTWIGAKGRGGYGNLLWLGRHTNSHRVAFGLSTGYWNAEVIRHQCGNRLCVRPSHLRAGTQKDNIGDALLAGTATIGSRNGQAALTPEDVRAIRKAHLAGALVKDLAVEFNLSLGRMSRVVNYRTYADVQ